jgi:glycosyltransferase involved in cell wall biosynthesis
VKVAVVFYALPPEGGGAHTFGGALLEAIRDAGASSGHSFVAYSAGGGPAPPGVTAIPFSRFERYRRRILYALRDAQDRAGMPRLGLKTWLEQSLERERVSLVWFATNYAEDCQLPFIFTVLDVEHVRQPWFPEVSRDGLWEQRHHYFSRYIPKATRVIVPNEAGAEQIMRAWGINRERILSLPHPTPRFALEAAEPDDRGLAELQRLGVRPPYLFYPAQFWAHKNHPLLFDALAVLNHSAARTYQLVLVGSDKGELERMRALARRLGLEEHVRFLGFVKDDELVKLYRHAHALTYPSRFGPENLPPLEAMALGCPVIAGGVPGAREQMGEAALLVSLDDPVELVDAVRRLDDPGLRDRLLALGRERAGQWTARDYVAGVVSFLDDFERLKRAWE